MVVEGLVWVQTAIDKTNEVTQWTVVWKTCKYQADIWTTRESQRDSCVVKVDFGGNTTIA